LFINVDESIVIFGPIDQVGCASASAMATSASSAETGGVLRAEALVHRAVLAVHRHQLTRAGLRPHAPHDRTGRDQGFLVGQRESCA
jgi:hypothetical protein